MAALEQSHHIMSKPGRPNGWPVLCMDKGGGYLRQEEYRARTAAVELPTDAMLDGRLDRLAAGRVFAGFNAFRHSRGSRDCRIAGGYTARDGSHR
jgi:hypothetical protein